MRRIALPLKTAVMRMYTSRFLRQSLPWQLTLVVVLGLFFSYLSLTKYPPVFIDEPWYANAAWNWLTSGNNFDPAHWPARPPALWAWVVSFALLGLGLFQARLVSWLFGSLLLLAVTWVGRKSYTTIVGLLAALLIALSWPFATASHYARPDIVLAALVMAALGVVLSALEKERWWLHLIAGLLIGSGADVHLNGAVMGIGLALLYPSAYGRKVLRKPGTWLFVIGAVLAFTSLGAPRLLTSQPDAVGVLERAASQIYKPLVMDFSLMNLLRSVLDEFRRYQFFENSLDLALIGAAVVFLLVRRSRVDRMLLTFVGTALVGFVLFVGYKTSLYAILFYPFFMLMVAEVAVSLLRRGSNGTMQRVFVGGLLLMFLFVRVWRTQAAVSGSGDYNYYAITERMRAVIPQDARVVGTPNWWLGLSEYDYVSSLGLTFYRENSGYSLTQAMETMHPDILIVDNWQRRLLRNEGDPALEGMLEFYKLPRQEFEDFLALRGEKLLTFADPWHGAFEIYAIDWE